MYSTTLCAMTCIIHHAPAAPIEKLKLYFVFLKVRRGRLLLIIIIIDMIVHTAVGSPSSSDDCDNELHQLGSVPGSAARAIGRFRRL